MAACLVINLVANRASSEQFAAARRNAFAAIAQYVLFSSMGIVVVSGLIALAATRSYINAAWAWVKALLDLSVFEATLLIVGSSHRQADRTRGVSR